ncbi:GNAT family N-acetyltransferase [Streptomyces sp. NBC_01451]|uniref:GNAT family N-acetyltransferase n=1 Tax=Streptomyces sp. NBC_01451 TaxID=2903872 RepID=UPI002E2F8AEF|nr:GNAT family N-acetyltransferase [Streptomyces sp. NBC_01451]
MTPRADIDVRTVTEDGLREWTRALSTGFLRSPEVTDTELEARRGGFLPGRTLGAYDGERCVATFRSFPQDLSVGAGATVPADAISNVTVSPTHRRRGILTRMMTQDLTAAKERGDVVATLIAAEYPIYGRYGFGPATWASEWTIDVPRAGLDPRWAGPADGGRIDLVDAADVRKLGPELHTRLARQQPGAVSRDERWWQVNTGVVRFGESWDEPFYAVHRSADGEIDGLVSYEAEDKWDAKQPQNTADVNWLIAATPAAERALWQYLCSIDWITRVKTGWRAPDDLLPFFLPNPRAARLTTHADWLWVRILDVVRALEARPYDGTAEGVTGGAAGGAVGGSRSLVLEVVDPAGFAGGRYRLDVSEAGVGSCTSGVRDAAEITLDVSELAALWLGDESAVRLAALGRVREERAGAARVADALLRTSRRPWCPDIF